MGNNPNDLGEERDAIDWWNEVEREACKDPDYIEWLQSQVSQPSFTDETEELLEEGASDGL